MKKFLINLFRFLRNGLSPARRYRYIRLSPIIFGKVFIFDKVEKKLLKVYAKTSSDLYTIDAILVNEEYKFQKYKTWGKYFTGDRPITFVDVGANIGIASFYMMNEFKKISTILIEPDCANIELSKQNTRNKETRFINGALSSHRQSYNIINETGNNNAYRIKLGEGTSSTLCIDDLEIDYEETSYYILKIDIEGHERNLFSDGVRNFRKFHIIIVEHHDWLFPGKAISKSLLKFLSEGRYDVVGNGNTMFCFNLELLEASGNVE